jgi:hypothetical protein
LPERSVSRSRNGEPSRCDNTLCRPPCTQYETTKLPYCFNPC